ncbi:MAG TPA: flavin reductase family protein [Magnetospirillaceae bacterium]|jgi:flavin reductase (DIM6/NTAB) family NADH-FMN oxidoreductase RutF
MPEGESVVDSERFKAALRLLPEPVAIVTTNHDGHKHGMTATAFASVSAEPPQILVCVNQRATSWGLIRDSGKFAVNFLPAKLSQLAHHFSKTADNKIDAFDPSLWKTLESGAPILQDAVSALDCVLEQQQLSGTHLILVGRVVGIWLGGGDDTLLYCAGAFGQFRKD